MALKGNIAAGTTLKVSNAQTQVWLYSVLNLATTVFDFVEISQPIWVLTYPKIGKFTE
jgi:hypothetical protein